LVKNLEGKDEELARLEERCKVNKKPITRKERFKLLFYGDPLAVFY
jgi:hypothetical protein